MRQIRERLYELGPGYFITNPRSERPSFFQYNGYALFRGRLHLNTPPYREAIQVLKGVFQDGDFLVVFQDRPLLDRENRRLSQRRQFLTKILQDDRRRELFGTRIEDFLHYIEETVDRCVRGMLPPNHFLLFTETLLFSRDNSDIIQDPHMDLDDSYSGKALLVFVALEPGTSIIIYPRSHRITKDHKIPFIPHRILLNVGEIFVFHPELYHCGDCYERSNLRIHYYVFAQPSLIWDNLTFPPRDGDLRLLHCAAERMEHNERALEGRERVRKQDEERVAGQQERAANARRARLSR
jgi:hypothetical protein